MTSHSQGAHSSFVGVFSEHPALEVTSLELGMDWPMLTHLSLLSLFSISSFLLPSFNLLSFAEGLQPWHDALVETTDAACHEAMQWVTHLQAHGSTSVLQALMASATMDPEPVAKQKHHYPLH